MYRELIGLCCGWFIVGISAALPAETDATVDRIPVIYSTDLLHPHDDPDDHYDLATLFSLPEFDVRGIVLDLGERQQQRLGRLPVEQILQLADRRARTRSASIVRCGLARTRPATCPRNFNAGSS